MQRSLTLTRRLSEADRLIERAIAMDPWSPWLWVRRGWLSAYAGDIDSAHFANCTPLYGSCRSSRSATSLLHRYRAAPILMPAAMKRAARWIQTGVQACPESFLGRARPGRGGGSCRHEGGSATPGPPAPAQRPEPDSRHGARCLAVSSRLHASARRWARDGRRASRLTPDA